MYIVQAVCAASAPSIAAGNTSSIDQIHFYQVRSEQRGQLATRHFVYKRNTCQWKSLEAVLMLLQAEKDANSPSQRPATPAQLLEASLLASQ